MLLEVIDPWKYVRHTKNELMPRLHDVSPREGDHLGTSSEALKLPYQLTELAHMIVALAVLALRLNWLHLQLKARMNAQP